MNRRNFVRNSALVVALPTLPKVAFAQDAPEAVWDETSQLFGNAFGILPTAPEGEIAVVQVITTSRTEPGDDGTFGKAPAFLLIHNNTGEELRADSFESADEDSYQMGDNFETSWSVLPGGYNLARVIIEIKTSLPADPDIAFTINPFTMEEMDWFGRERAERSLPVDQVSFQDGTLNARITNTYEMALRLGERHQIILFNQDGTMSNGARLRLEGEIGPGESMDVSVEVDLEMAEGQLYLFGFVGTSAVQIGL